MLSANTKSSDFKVSEKHQKEYEKLKNFLFLHTKRAYFVGGCVRDFFLNTSSNDYDIEVYDIDEKKFSLLMDELGAKKIGRSFSVYKWSVFDIALPRTETKISKGHTAFSTQLASDEKTASKRRDFTINAIMINIFSLELLDFWGGINDIKNKTIKLIDEEKFQEDSLRVLRAMQFASRLEFKIEEKTIQTCLKIPLSDLSKERIFLEFRKMFLSKNLIFGLYYAIRLDILNKLFEICINFKEFLTLSKNIKKEMIFVDKSKKEYFFLYNLYNVLLVDLESMLEKLQAPKIYQKELLHQKRRPKQTSKKFLIALSLHFPIKYWLGINKKIKIESQKLGIYENYFKHDIKIENIIKDGFVKNQISLEYKRQIYKKIRELL